MEVQNFRNAVVIILYECNCDTHNFRGALASHAPRAKQLYIAESKRGIIIGKGGENIRRLEVCWPY